MWNFPLFPDQASTFAGPVDTLFGFIFLVAAFFSLLIALLILIFAVKYHHKSKADRRGAADSHLLLELTWTAIPLGIVTVIFIWGAHLFYWEKVIPPNALEIFVVGKQWMWKIQHPEGQREINTLHVPVGQPILLTMISEDVIHDFAVPAFRIKEDVLPGRYTKQWFQATKIGEYHLFCNQYCGTLHAQMIGKIVVMSPSDYAAWLSGSRSVSQSADGQKLFTTEFNCISCHKPDGSGQGPSLLGVFGRRVELEGGKTVMADEGYIRESILKPEAKIVKGYKPIMPTYQGQVDEDQLTQLLVYIESLKGSK